MRISGVDLAPEATFFVKLKVHDAKWCCNKGLRVQRGDMELTELLQRVRSGERDALDAVIPLVYQELKKLAASHLRRETSQEPLQTTAMVHETYLRLVGLQHPSYENRSHFYGIASRLMRQILVDAARARAAEQRSGGLEVTLTSIADLGDQPDEVLLGLDEALNELARFSPLKSQLIEMRYFGGMTAEESAEFLSISAHVVRREMRLAKAWLRKEMQK
jgi:RNA polymerase sigma factor (TIGR02999 family)